MQAGLDWLIGAVTADFPAIDRRVRRDRANRAALQAESIRVDTDDPFIWKTPQRRTRFSIAQATLAAFEQATSMRWGGTVVPAKRNIPSDIEEAEDDYPQETEAAGITPCEVYGSERSVSVNSNGDSAPSAKDTSEDSSHAGEADSDTVDILQARWTALGLLWPDQRTCSSVLSSQKRKEHPVAESVRAQTSRTGMLGATHAAACCKDVGAGGTATQLSGAWMEGESGLSHALVRLCSPHNAPSMLEVTSYSTSTQCMESQGESTTGQVAPPSGDSPRVGVRLPPVQAWGSFRNIHGSSEHDASCMTKSDMPAKSQPGGTSACTQQAVLVEARPSTSPGQEGIAKVRQFA